VPRDEHGACVILARQEILRLLRQVVLPPDPIATVASQRENCR